VSDISQTLVGLNANGVLTSRLQISESKVPRESELLGSEDLIVGLIYQFNHYFLLLSGYVESSSC
jgi:hypothetical protein